MCTTLLHQLFLEQHSVSGLIWIFEWYADRIVVKVTLVLNYWIICPCSCSQIGEPQPSLACDQLSLSIMAPSLVLFMFYKTSQLFFGIGVVLALHSRHLLLWSKTAPSTQPSAFPKDMETPKRGGSFWETKIYFVSDCSHLCMAFFLLLLCSLVLQIGRSTGRDN